MARLVSSGRQSGHQGQQFILWDHFSMGPLALCFSNKTSHTWAHSWLHEGGGRALLFQPLRLLFLFKGPFFYILSLVLPSSLRSGALICGAGPVDTFLFTDPLYSYSWSTFIVIAHLSVGSLPPRP